MVLDLPNFKIHLIAGFIAGLIVIWCISNTLYEFPNQILLGGVVFATFFGLLPDFDKGDSKINEFVELCLIVGAFAGFLLGYMVLIVLCLGILFFSKFLTHRGLFHSVGVGVGLSAVLLFIVPVWGFFGFAGWITHLFLDYIPKFKI